MTDKWWFTGVLVEIGGLMLEKWCFNGVLVVLYNNMMDKLWFNDVSMGFSRDYISPPGFVVDISN